MGSDVESDGDGSSSSSPVAALRARGLAPKASSDLESLRALRRKLAESSNKNKNGVGAAKVLGDLARLGGYNSWDQVPTKRDPHGRNDGDLDALLMSPASEADVIRARDAFDATPKVGVRGEAEGGVRGGRATQAGSDVEPEARR